MYISCLDHISMASKNDGDPVVLSTWLGITDLMLKDPFGRINYHCPMISQVTMHWETTS
jgi:hypothetical protein